MSRHGREKILASRKSGPARIQAIRMFNKDAPVYIMQERIPLFGQRKQYSGVYAFISQTEVEFGSTGCLMTRFSQRFHTTQWATHVIWMELQCYRWRGAENRLLIEAGCINFCTQSGFLRRHVRNSQYSKTMGKFSGVDSAVSDLGTRFLHIIKRTCHSI